MAWVRAITVTVGLLSVLGACAVSQAAPTGDPRLAAAEKFVEQSDRYLHHSLLKRGMKGYGLTVMAGTEIQRFDVEIVSVLKKWGPHQDVILAKLSGLGLEKTGIIAGMSGSPVYMTDPRDGKSKMIGAVAYGWRFQNEPLCGIQPITQMLAVGEGVGGGGATTQPGAGIASAGGAKASSQYLRAVLGAQRIDFSALGRTPKAASAPSGVSQMTPLTTPLMVSGLHGRSLEMLSGALGGALTPVQSGGAGGVLDDDLRQVKLEPGSAIAIPLVSGDADLNAVGTVTEVADGRVLAFGHAMFGQGQLELPMGPAYIHTVVSSSLSSFKLGSSGAVTGTLHTDETVAIGGRVGQKVSTIPMAVKVNWPGQQASSFRYEIARHTYLTPMLIQIVLNDSVVGWRELPEHHTVRYVVNVDFEGLGRYTAQNIMSNCGVMPALSDSARPVYAMMNNPFGPPVQASKIDVEVFIESQDRSAEILALELDAPVYKPGETVTGTLTVRPFRKDKTRLAVKFQLPSTLENGRYTLEASDFSGALRAMQAEKPHLFDPRTSKELLAAIQRVVGTQANCLYLSLPLPSGGLAVDGQELPDLPPSKAAMLAEVGDRDINRFGRSLMRHLETEYVLEGSARASLTVEKAPKELRVLQSKGE